MQDSSSGDIRGGEVRDLVVTGWFTPDYRPLAERFAANLTQYNAPYHLWAKPKLDGLSRLERILLKPAIVLETMAAYPGKTVILMDTDCVIQGDISPMAQFPEDVGITVFTGEIPRRRTDWRIWLGTSTRVLVFRPTDAAQSLARKWAENVKTHGGHEERCMALAFLSSPSVRFHYMDLTYSGREITDLPDAVVGHDSRLHGQAKPKSGIRRLLTLLEKPFRSGRTQYRRHIGPDQSGQAAPAAAPPRPQRA
jgi:hypothetical protein